MIEKEFCTHMNFTDEESDAVTVLKQSAYNNAKADPDFSGRRFGRWGYLMMDGERYLWEFKVRHVDDSSHYASAKFKEWIGKGDG